jgi:hypothetical protein
VLLADQIAVDVSVECWQYDVYPPKLGSQEPKWINLCALSHYDISAYVTLMWIKQPSELLCLLATTKEGSPADLMAIILNRRLAHISEVILTGFTGKAKTFGFPLIAEASC